MLEPSFSVSFFSFSPLTQSWAHGEDSHHQLRIEVVGEGTHDMDFGAHQEFILDIALGKRGAHSGLLR